MGLSNCALALWLATCSPTEDVDGAFRTLAAEHPKRASVEEVGKSREGRSIHALRIGPTVPRVIATPALLVVAGMNGRDTASSEIALGIARGLLAGGHASDTAVTYIVAAPNPDAAHRYLRGEQPIGASGSLAPFDDDHDGRLDEDPPVDINGDGKITWMRVFDPPEGIARTHLADPNEPRLSRLADRTLGERATFAWIREGHDADGDGRYAEDGAGSITLDRNFPARFPEHEAHSGAFPLSEPESRALVDWLLTKYDIAAALVLGENDNLHNAPVSGKTDITGRAPLGLESQDAPYHAYVKHLYDSIVDRSDVTVGSVDGAVAAWLYGHYGVPTFAADITRSASDSERDDSEEAEEAGGDKDGDDESPSKDSDDRAPSDDAIGPPDRKVSSDEKAELAWLADADRTEGSTFDAFEEMTHPTLGRVEIGGPLEDARRTPSQDTIDDLKTRFSRFAAELHQQLPKLAIHDPVVTPIGKGVYRITLRITNNGLFPTMSAMGLRTRRALPPTLRMEGKEEQFLSGARIQRASAVPGSGGEYKAEWICVGSPGDTVRITVRGATIQEHVRKVTLPSATNGGGK